MPERPLRVIIAAENIPGLGTGLGYFLQRGVRQLAESQPQWRFKIVASSSFQELNKIEMPNLNIVFWDDTRLQCATTKLVSRFSPYASYGNYMLSRFMPSQWLKAKFGNLKALYRCMGDADVVWLPHYAIIGGHRFSSGYNLSSMRVPILFTIHDIHPVFFPDDWDAESRRVFWNEFVPFAERSQCIITHSQFQRESIIEHLKIEPKKVAVTPCPPLIDAAQLLKKYDQTETAAILSSHGISRPFALYPGSGGHTHKNHTRLLLAWAELKRRLGTQCPMLICTAKGHLWPSLKSLIDALGLQENVTFTDNVDTITLTKLYQSCAFVIVPTLYEGGGSGPVAEALISGKPVVCSKIPPIEEQLKTYGLDLSNSSVTFFKPDSVDSIVQATESAIQRLPELEMQAPKAQELLLSLSSKLWEDWGVFYSEQIRAIARKPK
jgi:glycosyltransferase involved in cell wall biosynthesis